MNRKTKILNKKYPAVIIGIIIVTAIIVLSSNLISNNESGNTPVILNGTSNSSKIGKHFDIELHESVGIRAKP